MIFSPMVVAMAMNLEQLKLDAFNRCQASYQEFSVTPVPMLDPPRTGGPQAEGMVYQEELAVRTTNILDRAGFYFSARPRAAVNTLPMEIYTGDKGFYRLKTWEDANPDYSSPLIVPPIDKTAIPPEGRVLTEVIIGHQAPGGGYPQLFDIRSSAYVRFAGYPPQITGASLRLGAHKIFGLERAGAGAREDFPVIRSIYLSVKNPSTAHAFVLLENRLFCGAAVVEMTEGREAGIMVDTHWYTREDFHWQEDPHTAFAAYSSMVWKTEKQTPESRSDEAHDSDVLSVKCADGGHHRISLDPEQGPFINDITADGQCKPVEWTLANEDRDPAHYADFQGALGSTNYNFRVSYRVAILESSVKTGVTLYQDKPDKEYGDNIVAASTIREDIKKSANINQFTRFKYQTTAFFPEGAAP